MTDYYFVIGKTLKGTVYSSKYLDNFYEAYQAFKSCCDMVQYFGGGNIDLYYIIDDDAEIIEHKFLT